MKIVIDIPEEDYEYIKNSNDANFNVIKNGTPLQEGALITKGQAVELVEFYKLNPQHFSFDNLIDDIHNEKPIIEADME